MRLPVARVVLSLSAAVSALALYAATSPVQRGWREEVHQTPIGVQLSAERPEVVISYSTTFDAKKDFLVQLGANANVELAPPPEGITEIEVSLSAPHVDGLPDSHTVIVLGDDLEELDSGSDFADTAADDGLDGDLVGLLTEEIGCGGHRGACVEDFEIRLRWISGPAVSGVVLADGAAFLPSENSTPKKMELTVSPPVVDGLVVQ